MKKKQRQEIIYKRIQSKMDALKARYPEELNIQGFEPALTADVSEVVEWYIKKFGSDIFDTPKDKV